MLTTVADSLSPTSAVAASKTTDGDDTIRAVEAKALGTVDFVDGGAGNDTLNITALSDGSGVATSIKPVVKNVETLNVTAVIDTGAYDTLDLGDSTGVVTLNSTGNTGTIDGNFANIALGTKLGVSNAGTGAVKFGFKAASVTGAADSADLNVAGNTTTGAVDIDGIETINITTAAKTGVAAANYLNLTGDVVETVTVAGSKAITLDLQGLNTTLKTVNASAATANLTIDLSAALTEETTVTLGSGADTITFAGSLTKKVTLDAGAGNDTVTIEAGAKHVINLGDGKDTLNLTAVTLTQASVLDTTTAAKLAASLVKVSGFTSGSDVLAITAGGAEVALTGTQLAAIDDTTTNVDLNAAAVAADAAAIVTKGGGALALGDAYSFQYNGNSYVIVESGGAAGFDKADYMVQLVGVTSVAAADITVV